MRIKTIFAYSLFITFILFVFLQTNAHARKKLLSGRGDGMATIQVTASGSEEVARAVKQVFGSDGYSLKSEDYDRLKFSRSSGKMKDFSYGGLAGNGTFEQSDH